MPDAKFPPPLPPRPIVREPFLPVIDRDAPTPRSGGVPAPEADERTSLQQELDNAHALIRALQQSQEPVTLTPVPPTRPSVRVRRAAIAKALGKYGAIATVLLPVVGFVARAIARKHPQYQELIDEALDWLGL